MGTVRNLQKVVKIKTEANNNSSQNSCLCPAFRANFPGSVVAIILQLVLALYFAGTTNPTSCFRFPVTFAVNRFPGAAVRKDVIKHESSIGLCPTRVAL